MSVGCAMRTMNQQLVCFFRCARRTLHWFIELIRAPWHPPADVLQRRGHCRESMQKQTSPGTENPAIAGFQLVDYRTMTCRSPGFCELPGCRAEPVIRVNYSGIHLERSDYGPQLAVRNAPGHFRFAATSDVTDPTIALQLSAKNLCFATQQCAASFTWF